MLSIANQCVLKLVSFFSIPDPNDETIPLQEKEKDVSSSQESSSKESPHDEYHEDNLLCPQLQDSDGNIQIKDACSDPQIL